MRFIFSLNYQIELTVVPIIVLQQPSVEESAFLGCNDGDLEIGDGGTRPRPVGFHIATDIILAFQYGKTITRVRDVKCSF